MIRRSTATAAAPLPITEVPQAVVETKEEMQPPSIEPLKPEAIPGDEILKPVSEPRVASPAAPERIWMHGALIEFTTSGVSIADVSSRPTDAEIEKKAIYRTLVLGEKKFLFVFAPYEAVSDDEEPQDMVAVKEAEPLEEQAIDEGVDDVAK